MIYSILNKNKLPDINGRCALFGIVRIGDINLHLQVYKRVGGYCGTDTICQGNARNGVY